VDDRPFIDMSIVSFIYIDDAPDAVAFCKQHFGGVRAVSGPQFVATG
jgi:hypothetical protein